MNLVLEASSNGGVINYLQLVDNLQTVPAPMKPVADACDKYACHIHADTMLQAC